MQQTLSLLLFWSSYSYTYNIVQLDMWKLENKLKFAYLWIYFGENIYVKFTIFHTNKYEIWYRYENNNLNQNMEKMELKLTAINIKFIIWYYTHMNVYIIMLYYNVS